MNEDERGDAFRGTPKLRLLVVLEYYLGVPWESLILGSFHSLFHSPSNLYPKLENFNHTKLKTKLVISTVLQLIYGAYHLILAIDSSK